MSQHIQRLDSNTDVLHRRFTIFCGDDVNNFQVDKKQNATPILLKYSDSKHEEIVIADHNDKVVKIDLNDINEI